MASLLALLHDEAEDVTHIAVAFDHPIRSFRNDLYDGYKTDEGVPPDLRDQFGAVEDAVRALGVVVWSMREYEADDALATGAHCYREYVEQVRILTPDKDLGQCLVGTRVVQVDRMRQRTIDEDALRAARGIGPESIPDFLALVGDAADGIPGLRGFGEKSASALLATYRHLDRIPDRVSEWKVAPRGAPSLAATLSAQREQAMLYRKLATLVTAVPLRESLEDLRFRGVPRGSFEAWCDEIGVDRLKSTPRRWAP